MLALKHLHTHEFMKRPVAVALANSNSEDTCWGSTSTNCAVVPGRDAYEQNRC